MRTDQRLIISLLTLLVSTAFFCGSAFAFGVGVAPSTIEMETAPGSVSRQVLRVKNFNQDKAIRLTVSSTDWTLTDSGEVELLPPKSIEQSATPWIRFSPSVLMLKPNSVGTVTVDIAPPVTGLNRGDYRTAIVVSTVLPGKKDREDKTGVWNRYQIASLFYANVNNGKSQPEIVSAGFDNADAENRRRLKIALNNTGNAHARLKGEVRLLDTQEKVVATMPLESVVLDKQTRDITLDFEKLDLAPGKYSADITLSENGRNLKPPKPSPGFTVH
jgi:hypothetical protein